MGIPTGGVSRPAARVDSGRPQKPRCVVHTSTRAYVYALNVRACARACARMHTNLRGTRRARIYGMMRNVYLLTNDVCVTLVGAALT